MNKKYGKFIEEIEESDEFPRSSKDFDHITLNDANTATKLERQRENNERENALKQNDEIISMRDKSPIITIRIDKNLNDQSDIMHDYNDISQLDLCGNVAKSGRNYVVQNTSFEEDISMGIHDAKEEMKVDYSNCEEKLTFLQFKLNDGRVLNTSVNLDTTTVLDLKEQVFTKDMEQGKEVRLLFMGKMMRDEEYLNNYRLVNMSYIHALVSVPLVRPEGATPSDGLIQNTDGKVGFDRFLRLRNKQYTDLQIHQLRLMFHSIMMRSGCIKTDETADDLLSKEEKWLNKELENDDYLLNLMNRKTVLSCRNDIVLPIYHLENEPIILTNENRDTIGAISFAIIGFCLPILSFFIFTLLIGVRESKIKGIYYGNIVAILLCLFYI